MCDCQRVSLSPFNRNRRARCSHLPGGPLGAPGETLPSRGAGGYRRGGQAPALSFFCFRWGFTSSSQAAATTQKSGGCSPTERKQAPGSLRACKQEVGPKVPQHLLGFGWRDWWGVIPQIKKTLPHPPEKKQQLNKKTPNDLKTKGNSPSAEPAPQARALPLRAAAAPKPSQRPHGSGRSGGTVQPHGGKRLWDIFPKILFLPVCGTALNCPSGKKMRQRGRV